MYHWRGPVVGKNKGEKGKGLRALICGCLCRLEAEDEEGLFRRVREHFEREHPKVSVDEEQLRGFVAHAYDVGYAVACSSGGRSIGGVEGDL